MWLVYSLTFVALTTVLALLMRTVSLKTHDQRAYAFLFDFGTLLVTLTALAFVGIGTVTLNPWYVFLILCAGVGHGLFHRYQFLARAHIEASAIEVIMAPASIVGYVLAVLWLNESVTLFKTIGFALVLGAGLLVSYSTKTKLTINKYALLAFAIAASASIAGTIDREVSQQFSSALAYAALLWAIKSAVCYIPYVKYTSLKKQLGEFRWYLALMAVLNAAILYCALSALQLAPATRVLPVLSSNVVFISLAAVIVLHEDKHVRRKLIAAAIACIGLFFVSY